MPLGRHSESVGTKTLGHGVIHVYLYQMSKNGASKAKG